MTLGGLVARGEAGQPAPIKEVPVASRHTATLLRDGRVLVTGGGTGLGSPSAFLFEPATGTWTETRPMLAPHVGHAAVGLLDGRVLVTGGTGSPSATRSAEIYDPQSGTWTATGEMLVGRQFHTATLLKDGRVLVAGGEAAGHGPYYGEADIFDPATGNFTPAARMEQGRAYHSAVALADGKVLVTGGEGDAHGDSLRDGIVFDPGANTWTVVPKLMSEGRVGQTTTLLDDGTVLIAGGTILRIGGRSENTRATVEIYDPTTQSFFAGPSLSKPRVYHTANRLADGRVLVMDETDGEIYDPAARSWSPAPAPPFKPETATLLADGTILVLAENQSAVYSLPVPVAPARESGDGSSDPPWAALWAGGGVLIVLGAGLALARRKRLRQG